jgi:hypothetical protein
MFKDDFYFFAQRNYIEGEGEGEGKGEGKKIITHPGRTIRFVYEPYTDRRNTPLYNEVTRRIRTVTSLYRAVFLRRIV